MKNILFALLLSVSSVYASHTEAQISTRGLTTEQAAEIQLQVEKLKSNATSSEVSVEKVSKWVDIGTNVGKGLAGAAKELGIVANDFAGTFVGKLTMALIIWHMAGSMIIHVVAGICFFTVMLPLWFYVYRRYAALDRIEITRNEQDKLMKKIVQYNDSQVRTFEMLFVLGVITAIGSIITFTW